MLLGTGPQLGVLTALAYFIFMTGASMLWRDRERIFLWWQDEFYLFRRTLSRHTMIGPFYVLREESRIKTMPAHFRGMVGRFPRHRVNPGFYLVLLAPLLFLLDFFV